MGPVAHRGHCVARHEGRVVFVRHALPGERVVAQVTEDGGGSYCRADAIRVLRASAHRVPPPCPCAGPGRCGGFEPRTGEIALDLYAGAVGPAGRVVAVEADPAAAADCTTNLAGSPAEVEVRPSRVTPGLLGGLAWRGRPGPDLVVLDPPRAGAGPEVMAAVVARRPRAVASVACDPSSLARDLRVALDAGWWLRELRAYDCFPMTAHVETVALLCPGT